MRRKALIWGFALAVFPFNLAKGLEEGRSCQKHWETIGKRSKGGMCGGKRLGLSARKAPDQVLMGFLLPSAA